MPTVLELQDEERKCLDQARATNEKVQNEGRDFTDSEAEEVDKLINQADIHRTGWERQKKRETLNTRLTVANAGTDRRSPIIGLDGKPLSNDQTRLEWQGANNGTLGRRLINIHGRQGQLDYHNAFQSMLNGDSHFQHSSGATNDIRSEIESQGGYFIMPQRMAGQIIKNIDDEVFMQKYATVMTVDDARSLGVTVRKAKANTFVWGSELGTLNGTQDTSLKWGKRKLEPQYLVGSIDISRDFLFYVPNGEGRVLHEVAIDGGEKLEQGFLYGTGVGQPLGIMTPSPDGIDTDRDISEGTTVDTFTFDTLIGMKYAMKPKYIDATSTVLMMHRLFIKDIALFRDGQGRYMWEPSRQNGEPDRVIGVKYISSEWMPSTRGAGKYFALLGDLSWYWIAYAMREFTMQRLNEMKAYTNQYEYLFRTKVDGAPMKAEAFIRGKFAAS